MSEVEGTPRVVTIREAAELTGLTDKALRRRIERGRLLSVLSDGRRRIPYSALDKQGLILPPGERGAEEGTTGQPAADLLPLVEKLAEQAEQLGKYRLLAEQAGAERESRERVEADFHRVRSELEQAKQQIEELEQQQLPWWRRGRKKST